MNWKLLKWRIRYGAQYIPFTLNTVLCGIAAYVAYKVLYTPPPKAEPSPFRPFIIIMGKVAFWFLAALVLVSVLSTIFSWLHYLWLKRNRGYNMQVSFETESKNGKKNKLFLSALLQGVTRPILGFVKGRLFYDDGEMTDAFNLSSNKRKEQSIWRAAITGRSRMSLPDIKEYQLKGGFIYFQDMLHLFSLAVAQPVGGQFYQPPVLTREDEKEVFPKKTETMDVRIEQLRRVEGEYLNYKDFEAGDDVRRIVWKVYAKNRELVVRTPELYEPYASHLYFYASFHASVKAPWLGEGYLKEMLNYFKNRVWTVYDTLSKKEWDLRYIPDQSFTVPEHLNKRDASARIISNSVWHGDKGVAQYFSPKQGAVLCISSLTDVDELEQVLEQCDGGTVVYFIKLSQTFRHFAAWGWAKRLILLPPKDRLGRLKDRWLFSPIRAQLHKREKAIEALLAKSNVTSGTL